MGEDRRQSPGLRPDLGLLDRRGSPAAGPASALEPGGELTAAQFGRLCGLLHRICGIRLQPGKEQLVRARLGKRLRVLGHDSYGTYLDFVESPAGRSELAAMVDALTTNKTSFFREPAHIDFLREEMRRDFHDAGRLRIWSAGCSFGHEPYTLALILAEEVPGVERRDFRILATDISARVLEQAREGVYREEEVRAVPPETLRRHFVRQPGSGPAVYRVGETPRRLVRFARHNLMDAWPMRGPFDFVFCRNVMIYFDRETQEDLARRFAAILRPGGHLLTGHSESLSGRVEGLRLVRPALYRKEPERGATS